MDAFNLWNNTAYISCNKIIYGWGFIVAGRDSLVMRGVRVSEDAGNSSRLLPVPVSRENRSWQSFILGHLHTRKLSPHAARSFIFVGFSRRERTEERKIRSRECCNSILCFEYDWLGWLRSWDASWCSTRKFYLARSLWCTLQFTPRSTFRWKKTRITSGWDSHLLDKVRFHRS